MMDRPRKRPAATVAPEGQEIGLALANFVGGEQHHLTAAPISISLEAGTLPEAAMEAAS